MTTLTPDQIKTSVEEAWTKLNSAIQRDLDAVLDGKANLTASNASAVLKFIELSAGLTKTIPYLNRQQHQTNRPLPVFNDEPDTIS